MKPQPGLSPACAGTMSWSSCRLPPLKGSSPHTWGPQERDLDAARVAGIIPTRVGTTRAWNPALSPGRDHPHTRGDHGVLPGFSQTKEGSSPHAWGPLAEAFQTACARRDHPRLRGDHHYDMNGDTVDTGSSPPTRGPPSADIAIPFCTGIIPAYAGTTEVLGELGARVVDHPRLRGDHRAGQQLRERHQGSSPPTRGPPGEVVEVGAWVGIIPAYAGTTTLLRSTRC